MEDAEFITGMGKLESKVVILLDIDSILSSQEIDAVVQTGQ